MLRNLVRAVVIAWRASFELHIPLVSYLESLYPLSDVYSGRIYCCPVDNFRHTTSELLILLVSAEEAGTPIDMIDARD